MRAARNDSLDAHQQRGFRHVDAVDIARRRLVIMKVINRHFALIRLPILSCSALDDDLPAAALRSF